MRFLLLAIERAHRVGAEIAIDADVAFGLERLHRVAHRVVVKRIVFVTGDVEPLAQRRNARVLHAGAQDLAFGHMHARLCRLVLGLVVARFFRCAARQASPCSALNSGCGGL